VCAPVPNYTRRVHTEDVVRDWDNVRTHTMRVAELVPARCEWSPGEGAMTFADLLRRLVTTERWTFTGTVAGRPSR
jgi:hypothetical protein